MIPALVLVAALAGCGGQGTAVRVGSTTIGSTLVAHWIEVLAPGHVVPEPPGYAACVARERELGSGSTQVELVQECRQQYRTLQRRALGLLISSAWVANTVAQDGLRVTEDEVEQRLRERGTPQAAEGGDGADAKVAARTELGEAKLREKLTSEERPVTDAQVAAYYRSHPGQFVIPEKRYLDVENLKTEAAALKIRREYEAGERTSFARGILHEMFESPSPIKHDAEREAVLRALFAARPNVLIGPFRNIEYTLIVVKRIVPLRHRSLAQMRGAILERLSAERRRAALIRFIAAWRRRWIALTDCYPGYVVQKCKQYSGPLAPENQLGFD